jgi:hypothetical protein
MLATFCLRLACGLVAALLVLSPAQVNPRFYRVQFLTILGLTALAVAVLWQTPGVGLWLALAAALALAFLGSLAWSLEGAPGGRLLIGLSLAAQGAALAALAGERSGETERMVSTVPLLLSLADDLTSALLLGAATTAMLMGHSYLIAPGMSITPLLQLVATLFAATLLRMLVAGVTLWCWTAGRPALTPTDETVLWLPLRWGLGFAAPLILGWMAWEAAKIRSTQSATGILYVVVIFCFLGELTSQLLASNGFPL